MPKEKVGQDKDRVKIEVHGQWGPWEARENLDLVWFKKRNMEGSNRIRGEYERRYNGKTKDVEDKIAKEELENRNTALRGDVEARLDEGNTMNSKGEDMSRSEKDIEDEEKILRKWRDWKKFDHCLR